MDTDAVQVDPRRVELTELVIESFRDRQGPAIHHRVYSIRVFSSARDVNNQETTHAHLARDNDDDNDDNKKIKIQKRPLLTSPPSNEWMDE